MSHNKKSLLSSENIRKEYDLKRLTVESHSIQPVNESDDVKSKGFTVATQGLDPEELKKYGISPGGELADIPYDSEILKDKAKLEKDIFDQIEKNKTQFNWDKNNAYRATYLSGDKKITNAIAQALADTLKKIDEYLVKCKEWNISPNKEISTIGSTLVTADMMGGKYKNFINKKNISIEDVNPYAFLPQLGFPPFPGTEDTYGMEYAKDLGRKFTDSRRSTVSTNISPSQWKSKRGDYAQQRALGVYSGTGRTLTKKDIPAEERPTFYKSDFKSFLEPIPGLVKTLKQTHEILFSKNGLLKKTDSLQIPKNDKDKLRIDKIKKASSEIKIAYDNLKKAYDAFSNHIHANKEAEKNFRKFLASHLQTVKGKHINSKQYDKEVLNKKYGVSGAVIDQMLGELGKTLYGSYADTSWKPEDSLAADSGKESKAYESMRMQLLNFLEKYSPDVTIKNIKELPKWMTWKIENLMSTPSPASLKAKSDIQKVKDFKNAIISKVRSDYEKDIADRKAKSLERDDKLDTLIRKIVQTYHKQIDKTAKEAVKNEYATLFVKYNITGNNIDTLLDRIISKESAFTSDIRETIKNRSGILFEYVDAVENALREIPQRDQDAIRSSYRKLYNNRILNIASPEIKKSFPEFKNKDNTTFGNEILSIIDRVREYPNATMKSTRYDRDTTISDEEALKKGLLTPTKGKKFSDMNPKDLVALLIRTNPDDSDESIIKKYKELNGRSTTNVKLQNIIDDIRYREGNIEKTIKKILTRYSRLSFDETKDIVQRLFPNESEKDIIWLISKAKGKRDISAGAKTSDTKEVEYQQRIPSIKVGAEKKIDDELLKLKGEVPSNTLQKIRRAKNYTNRDINDISKIDDVGKILIQLHSNIDWEAFVSAFKNVFPSIDDGKLLDITLKNFPHDISSIKKIGIEDEKPVTTDTSKVEKEIESSLITLIKRGAQIDKSFFKRYHKNDDKNYNDKIDALINKKILDITNMLSKETESGVTVELQKEIEDYINKETKDFVRLAVSQGKLNKETIDDKKENLKRDAKNKYFVSGQKELNKNIEEFIDLKVSSILDLELDSVTQTAESIDDWWPTNVDNLDSFIIPLKPLVTKLQKSILSIETGVYKDWANLDKKYATELQMDYDKVDNSSLDKMKRDMKSLRSKTEIEYRKYMSEYNRFRTHSNKNVKIIPAFVKILSAYRFYLKRNKTNLANDILNRLKREYKLTQQMLEDVGFYAPTKESNKSGEMMMPTEKNFVGNRLFGWHGDESSQVVLIKDPNAAYPMSTPVIISKILSRYPSDESSVSMGLGLPLTKSMKWYNDYIAKGADRVMESLSMAKQLYRSLLNGFLK